MFLVDSADTERLSESKAELDALLSIEELSKVSALLISHQIASSIFAGYVFSLLLDCLGSFPHLGKQD